MAVVIRQHEHSLQRSEIALVLYIEIFQMMKHNWPAKNELVEMLGQATPHQLAVKQGISENTQSILSGPLHTKPMWDNMCAHGRE